MVYFETIIQKVALFVLFPLFVFGAIVTSDTLYPLQEELKRADSSLLVLFDVDDTLLYREDPLLHPLKRDRFKVLWGSLEKQVGETQAKILKSRLFNAQTTALVDPSILDLIRELKGKGALCLGLTAFSTGSFGEISSMEDWRERQLKGYGFHFSLEELPKIRFEALTKEGMTPVFQQGVIYTAKSGKGAVLSAFLKATGLHPKRIILIDDEMQNLNSVEQAVARLEGVSFLGIDYRAAYKIETVSDEVEEEKQLEILLKEGVWRPVNNTGSCCDCNKL